MRIGLSNNDRLWVEYFATRARENFGPVRDGLPPRSREVVLAFVRSMSEPAWCSITGQPLPVARSEPTEAQKAYVSALVLREVPK